MLTSQRQVHCLCEDGEGILGERWLWLHSLVRSEAEPKIGDVTEVTYDTPNYGGKQDYRVKVTDKADKIQFVYANGGTTTLTRLDPRVSIKSYDAQGNEVYANSTNLAYEIWTVNFNLPAGNYVVRAKYGRNTWSEGLAVNVVISAKPATAVSVTEVNASADSVAVTVNGTAKKVKITYASGATRTFNRDDANVSIASNGDGEIWTINVKLTEGDYTATAKYITTASRSGIPPTLLSRSKAVNKN